MCTLHDAIMKECVRNIVSSRGESVCVCVCFVPPFRSRHLRLTCRTVFLQMCLQCLMPVPISTEADCLMDAPVLPSDVPAGLVCAEDDGQQGDAEHAKGAGHSSPRPLPPGRKLQPLGTADLIRVSSRSASALGGSAVFSFGIEKMENSDNVSGYVFIIYLILKHHEHCLKYGSVYLHRIKL